MKLATFTESAHTRIGLLQGDHVIDLSKAAATLMRVASILLRSKINQLVTCTILKFTKVSNDGRFEGIEKP